MRPNYRSEDANNFIYSWSWLILGRALPSWPDLLDEFAIDRNFNEEFYGPSSPIDNYTDGEGVTEFLRTT